MRTSAVAPAPSGHPERAPAHSRPGSVQARPPAAQLITGGRRLSLPSLAIPLVDQASKATQPAGKFTVNTGGPAILLGDTLWKSPTLGAACDSIDAVLLIAALIAVRTVTNTSERVAVTAVLAGLLSNLGDRLGASSLFHAGLPRGSIDWIPVPAWPSAKTNIADIVIALGILALTYHAACRTIRASQALARLVPATRLAAAATGVIALAVWTATWQANRHTAELHPTTRSETPSQCPAAIAYSSDGMDWVSHRPAAGPLPYHDTSCRTSSDG